MPSRCEGCGAPYAPGAICPWCGGQPEATSVQHQPAVAPSQPVSSAAGSASQSSANSWGGCLGAVVVIAFTGWACSLFNDSPPPAPPPPVAAPTPELVFVLTNEFVPEHRNEPVFVFTSSADLDQAGPGSTRQDEPAFKKARARAYLVQPGTRAEIKYSVPQQVQAEVRILEGPHERRIGWVTRDQIQPQRAN